MNTRLIFIFLWIFSNNEAVAQKKLPYSKNVSTPYLLAANYNIIRLIDDEGHDPSTFIVENGTPFQTDFFCQNSRRCLVFWNEGTAIFRGIMTPTDFVIHGEKIVSLEHPATKLLKLSSLCVDWEGMNLFWITVATTNDINVAQIEASTFDGLFQTVIISALMSNPRGLAVDSAEGLLFWTDTTEQKALKNQSKSVFGGKIERAALSGDRREIIWETDKDMRSAVGLTLDFTEKRIYWFLENQERYIHSVGYNGKNYMTLKIGQSQIPQYMVVSASEFFWIANGNEIFKAPKSNISNVRKIHQEIGTFVGLKLFGLTNEQMSDENPCANPANGGCSHFCLKDTPSTAKCGCPYMMTLDEGDRKTCIELDTAIVTVDYIAEMTLFEDGKMKQSPCYCSVIMAYELNAPFKNVVPVTVHETYSTIMDVDTVHNILYFAKDKSTIATFNLPSGKKLINSSWEKEPSKIISFGENAVTGMAIDSFNQNLYVSLLTKVGAEITVVSLRNRKCRRTILPVLSADELRNPSYLVLHPMLGKMYWVDEGFWPSTINSANMDGSGKKELDIDPDFSLSPGSLAVDLIPNSLYWVDDNQDIVFYDLTTGTQNEERSYGKGPISVYKGRMYFYNSKYKDLGYIDSRFDDVIVVRENVKIQRLFLYNKLSGRSESCDGAPLCMATPNGTSTCECDVANGCPTEKLPKALDPAYTILDFPKRDCKLLMYPEGTMVIIKGCKHGWFIAADHQSYKNENFMCKNGLWSHNGQQVIDIRCLKPENRNRLLAIGLGTAIPFLVVVVCLVVLLVYRRQWYMYRNLQRLPLKTIQLEAQLGSGNFGEIWLATLERQKTAAVIKILKETATDREEKEFREEAMLMSRFDSDYIIKTLGICLESRPIMLALEFMNGGSVEKYLKRRDVRNCLSSTDLMLIVQDALKGCIYLEDEGYIHRDLAARNCLVQTISETNLRPKRAKLTDFGLAKDITSTKIYESRDPYANTLPIAWTAPEAFDGKFSPKSDIWSFGVLIWEVFTWGQVPFQGCPNRSRAHLANCPVKVWIKVCCSQVYMFEPMFLKELSNEQIEHMVCFEKKTLADYGNLCGIDFPNTLWGVMIACWCFEPANRPGFKRLQKLLNDTKQEILRAVFLRNLSRDPHADKKVVDRCSAIELSQISIGSHHGTAEKRRSATPDVSKPRMSRAYDNVGDKEDGLSPARSTEKDKRHSGLMLEAYGSKGHKTANSWGSSEEEKALLN